MSWNSSSTLLVRTCMTTYVLGVWKEELCKLLPLTFILDLFD